MTPALYTAHVKAWRKRERRTQARFAMLAHVVAQCGGNDVEISDFMAGLDTEEDEE